MIYLAGFLFLITFLYFYNCECVEKAPEKYLDVKYSIIDVEFEEYDDLEEFLNARNPEFYIAQIIQIEKIENKVIMTVLIGETK
jgi:hypothetical protein